MREIVKDKGRVDARFCFGIGRKNMSKKRQKTARMGILCLRSLVSYEIISNFVVRKDV